MVLFLLTRPNFISLMFSLGDGYVALRSGEIIKDTQKIRVFHGYGKTRQETVMRAVVDLVKRQKIRKMRMGICVEIKKVTGTFYCVIHGKKSTPTLKI